MYFYHGDGIGVHSFKLGAMRLLLKRASTKRMETSPVFDGKLKAVSVAG